MWDLGVLIKYTNTKEDKVMNKKTLLILAAFLSLVIAMPMHVPMAQAQDDMSMGDSGMRKKRYRYRKRTHRVQVGVDSMIPFKKTGDNTIIALNLMYGYNAGLFEVGPNIAVAGTLSKLALNGGLWAEFNIIKNTRKEKFVPAIGVKANYMKLDNQNNLLLAPYLALKYFPASRTGLILNINYNIVTPFDRIFKFKDMNMAINLSLAYAHYFHF